MSTTELDRNEFFEGAEPIEISRFPMFPTPWDTEGEGGLWTWGHYFLILLKNPKPLYQTLCRKTLIPQAGMKVSIPFAMLVYEKLSPTLTLSDQVPNPIFAVLLDQIQYGSTSPGIFLETYEAKGLTNIGKFADPIDEKSVTENFFSIIKTRFSLIEEPKFVGSAKEAFGNPETGLDKKENYSFNGTHHTTKIFPSINSTSTNPVKRKIGELREKSSRIDPLFIKFLIGCLVIVVICVYFVVKDSKETPQPTAPVASIPQIDKTLLDKVQKPSEGTDNVLGIPEINWCITEQIALDAQEKILKNKTQVRYYNERVKDYNKRCARFRYKPHEYQHSVDAVLAKKESIIKQARDDLIKLSAPTVKKTENKPSDKVMEVQRKLKQLKYSVSVDGELGPKTVEAIKRFQKSNSMSQTGIIDDKLMSALDRATRK